MMRKKCYVRLMGDKFRIDPRIYDLIKRETLNELLERGITGVSDEYLDRLILS